MACFFPPTTHRGQGILSMCLPIAFILRNGFSLAFPQTYLWHKLVATIAKSMFSFISWLQFMLFEYHILLLSQHCRESLGLQYRRGSCSTYSASTTLFLTSETSGLAQVVPFDCHFVVLLSSVSASSCSREYHNSCTVCSISFLNPEVTKHKQGIPTSGWWSWASRSRLALSPCSSRAGNQKNKNCLWNAFLPLVGHKAGLAPRQWSTWAYMKALLSVGSCLCCLAV